MLLFLPIVLLIIVLGALGFIVRYRPDYRSFWLVNISGPLLAWLSLLFLWAELPLQRSMTYWHLSTGPNFNLLWLLDASSWPLLFGIASLLLASYLSNVRSLTERSVSSWLPGIAIVAGSMLAVIAANLLALLIAWMFLDLLVLVQQLTTDQEPLSLRQALYSFLANLIGSMLLLWTIVAYGAPSGLPIANLPQETHLLLVLVAGIRLGVLPLNPFVVDRSAYQKDLSIHIRLAQVAASLALLIRIDSPLANYAPLLITLALLAALFGSVKFLLAKKRNTALSYWILSLTGFVVVAAINGQSTATLAWVLVLILGGAFLFLSQTRQPNRWLALLWGLILLAAMPFGSNFAGAAIFRSSGTILSYAFFFPASLLIVGWVRQAQLSSSEGTVLERWESLLYQSGLILLLLSHLALAMGLAPALRSSPTLLSAWPSAVLLLLAGILWLLTSRPFQLAPNQSALVEELFSLRWFYRLAGQLLRQLAVLLRLTGSLLEGRAGVLWALLLVALLLSLISQLNPT